ncbi:UNVERIFIED_CONTAM: hypothetical protein PYX00_009514 [Menopon gallinae]|uniref:Uncharacterized protein n=1 Tax=Menopon gallinae TaxID=328185 RepID=A0AAW2HBI1_9NEOP
MENGEANGELFSEPSFWAEYSALKDRINACKRKGIPLDEYDPCQICADIEENILGHDDEQYLSPLQNKVRKLAAGTDLCREICLLQLHFSDMEINNAVSEALSEKRYNEIVSRIRKKRQLELKREKFFYTQALKTIRKSFGDEEDEDIDEDERIASEVPESERTLPSNVSQLRSTRRAAEDQPSTCVDVPDVETARVPTESFDERLQTVSHSTEANIRNLAEADVTVPEEPEKRQSTLESELMEIEQILEAELEITETEGPVDDLGSLSTVTTVPERRKRRYPPVFDTSTQIPNYSERARRLNRSITVERVQVYEGAPRLIHAFSVTHAFETPAVNNGLYGNVRSSVLERLYARHQRTQQVPHNEGDNDFPTRRSTQMVSQEVATSQIRSAGQRSHLLDASAVEQNLTEMRGSVPSTFETVQMQLERLCGTPVSRLLQTTDAVPPQMPAAEPWLPPRSPRIQNLQGKEIDRPMTSPWFTPVEQMAPQEKWREFKYVRERLEEIWREKEESRLEKEASLKEILGSEWYRENMVTLLRVVDKMSLRREVVLKGIGEKVVVQPFEVPYVTEQQYRLRFEEMQV